MDMKNLSICIVGKDKANFLKQCIDSCLALSRRISYVDMGSEDNSTEVAEISGAFAEHGSASREIPETLRKFHKSNWILFLRPDEKISYESDAQITQTLKKSQASGYSLAVREEINPEILDGYQWSKTPHIRKPDPDTDSVYISKVEIRVVRHNFFDKFLQQMISPSKEAQFSFQSQLLKGIHIHSFQNKKVSAINDPHKNREQEIEYLKQEISYSLDDGDGAIELGDNFLIYSVLTKEDIARYYRGVEMGFGSEKMYLTMLHYLGKFGRFEEARDFFETWESKWGFFDTKEPYRLAGIVYANLFDWNKSVFCFEKYLESPSKHYIGQATSSLAKSCLLQGKREKAISTLKRSFEYENELIFDRQLLASIERPDWKKAKISLCMIVKDEEACIRRALQSVSQIVDDIVIVDTGSRDRTKEIAEEFGCKIIDAPWEDDFSKTRNLCIREASGDYILCMDADEFIDPRERINLILTKHILSAQANIAYRVKMEHEEEEEEMLVMLRLPKSSMSDYPIRLFPALRNIYFEGTAFETMERSLLLAGVDIAFMDLFKITHANLDRQWRDARMADAVRNAFTFIEDFDIALKGTQFFLRNGDMGSALKWIEKSNFNNPKLLAKIAAFFLIQGQRGFMEIIEKWLGKFPESIELKLVKAWLCCVEGKHEETITILKPHMDKITDLTERHDAARAHYIYSMSLLSSDKLKEGIDHMSYARDIEPRNILYKIGGIYAFFKGNHWEGIITAINDILKDEDTHFDTVIHNFNDIGMLFLKLSQYFLDKKSLEASLIFRRMVEEMAAYTMLIKNGTDDAACGLNIKS
jgi:pentatricopeptide repeat protein